MYAESADPTSDLFLRARAGDELAWRELFDRSYKKVRRAVSRKMNPPMRSLFDSTDFANEVFGSLVAKFHRFDFPNMAAFVAFMQKAAEQKLLDEERRMLALKRDRRRERPLTAAFPGEEQAGMSFASSDPTPSQVAVAKESYENVRSGLDKHGAQAIELATEGYSTHEIAEKTGWQVRKVQRFFKSIGESWRLRAGTRP